MGKSIISKYRKNKEAFLGKKLYYWIDIKVGAKSHFFFIYVTNI